MRFPGLLILVFLVACNDVTVNERPEAEGDDAGECSDAADNDLDGLFDCQDPDCAGSSDCGGDDDDATADDDDATADDDDSGDDDDATANDDDSAGDDDDATANDDDATANDDDATADDDDATADDDDSAGDDDDSAGGGGPTVIASGTCTGQVWTYSANPVTSPELNIIGMYESTGGHGAPGGTTTVDILRPGPMTLVLSSYEPVNWDINAPGVQIDQIILNGYNQHTVTGISGVPIVDLTTPGSYWVACGYAWPSSTGGCDTPGLVAGAQGFTGLTLSSFQGCYHGTAWTIQ